MNSNEIALLNLIKKSLFNADITFSEDTDWEEVHKEASLQMVMALTAGAVPESEAAKWLEPAAQSTSHYLKMLFEQKKPGKPFHRKRYSVCNNQGNGGGRLLSQSPAAHDGRY
jgi:hypothetical protein